MGGPRGSDHCLTITAEPRAGENAPARAFAPRGTVGLRLLSRFALTAAGHVMLVTGCQHAKAATTPQSNNGRSVDASSRVERRMRLPDRCRGETRRDRSAVRPHSRGLPQPRLRRLPPIAKTRAPERSASTRTAPPSRPRRTRHSSTFRSRSACSPRASSRTRGSQNLTDLTRYVPGVAIHQGEGNRDELVIRGVDSSANFFVNGFRDDVQIFSRSLQRTERRDSKRVRARSHSAAGPAAAS